MTEPIEILRYARDVVLDSEEKWTRWVLARKGQRFESIPDGEQFCALGATERARWELTGSFTDDLKAAAQTPEARILRQAVPPHLQTRGVDGYNDTRFGDNAFSQVIDLFDRAVKHLEDPDAA